MKILTIKKIPMFAGALMMAALPLASQADSVAVNKHQDVNSQPLMNTGASVNSQQIDWSFHDLSGYSDGVAEAARRMIVKENQVTSFDAAGKYESATRVGHGQDW
ncbi:hypothetical protein FGL86_04690 [Pistricoccus aurantiacus]|uniref:Uncharacterized protein n=1 Tax=Pistricoccus aurantiacus TaxID=1883414 RepID=A0A5B8STU0_9GAMM|nr:hypothetical protein [Pistricoccus aurantiacus]QEA38443.1 hypothetical protein FGL86_04690 [Pistricoccus aurantiacus]